MSGVEPAAVAPPSGRRFPAGAARLVVAGLVIAAAVFSLYRPVSSFELMGDDYQWWQHAHAATHHPLLLLADLDTFYRPASTWTLVLDRLLLGDSPAGFHLTNVAFHAAAGVLLFLVAGRLGLPLAESAAVGALWALSPFSEEPAISVAIRFQDLLLMAWLGLILAWPGKGATFTRARVAAVAVLTLLAAASKESWVMTAALVPPLEAAAGRWEFRSWLRRAAPFAVAAGLYTAVYFAVFPGGKGYFSLEPGVLFKLPHQLAAFLGLERLAPSDFPLGWTGVLAAAVITGLAIIGWRRRMPAAMVGSALLLVPMAPTLLVPFLPTRYTAIPSAGFLLLAAGWTAWARRNFPGKGRWGVAVMEGVLAALVLVTGIRTVRADLLEYAQVSAAHGRLLEEARRVMPQLPLDRPVVVVRGERDNLLAEIGGTPGALAKPYFVRARDPYGLIDAAALFEWTLHREGVAFRPVEGGSVRDGPAGVVVHRVGGFQWLGNSAGGARAEASSWLASGVPVRVIEAVPLD